MEMKESPEKKDNSGPAGLDEVASAIVAGAGRLAAATCRWLLLVADFDARDGAYTFGLASSAQWLSFHCGIAHCTALDQVRVARALAAFPRMVEEMTAGRLSYSQARAIARIARPGEHRLVEDLCERHHVALHDGAYRIRKLGRGAFRFETPDGVDLAYPIEASAPAAMPAIETEHADVDARAATTKWDGQRLQRDYAVSVLARRRYSSTG